MNRIIGLLAIMFFLFSSLIASADVLILKRVDGSTYTLEGEVKYYEDNKFTIELNSGGDAIFSIKQVQAIKFEAAKEKKVVKSQKIDEQIENKLKRIVSVHFDNAHIRNVLGYLSEINEVKIVLDESIFPPGEEFVEGQISPRVTIDLEDISLLEVLDTTLRLKGLTYKVEKDFIRITSQEKVTGKTVQEVVDLKASVKFSGTQFIITNNNNFDWIDVEITVNPSGFLMRGFVLKTPRMQTGETYTVGAMQFAKADGTRFNPYTTKPQELSIWCNTSKGKGYYVCGWE